MISLENHIETQALFNLDQSALGNPYAIYDHWREIGPVVFLEEQQIYVVTRPDLIRSINRKPDVFSNQNPLGPSSEDAALAYSNCLKNRPAEFIEKAMKVLARGNVLFTADPPEHTRHRRLLNGALKRSAIANFRHEIDNISKSLVENIPREEVINVIDHLTVPAPIRCLARLLDVPSERDPDFYRWATAINSTIGTSMPPNSVNQIIDDQMDFWGFFEKELSLREGSHATDLLSAIANASSIEDAPLELTEKVGFCAQLVGAGADTTTKLIGFSILSLTLDIELQNSLRNNEDMVAPFLEEMLRLEPPVQGMFRVATKDTVLEDLSIPKGANLWLLYAAANRDKDHFKCPHDINLDRISSTDHLSFGSGPHICIGANLAREVAHSVVKELLNKTEVILGYKKPSSLVMQASYIMHGFNELPVLLR